MEKSVRGKLLLGRMRLRQLVIISDQRSLVHGGTQVVCQCVDSANAHFCAFLLFLCLLLILFLAHLSRIFT